MMTNNELIQCIDSIESALDYMKMVDEITQSSIDTYVFSTVLAVHDYDKVQEDDQESDPHSARIRINENINSPNSDLICNSSIAFNGNTWLKYKQNAKPFYTDCSILHVSNNLDSISLTTCAASNTISYGGRTVASIRHVFEMHQLGTPDCDEYLFLKSLEFNDIIMNAVMIQYEWRRRYGSNIILRIGRDPVQTCAEIERIAKVVYDRKM